MYTPDNNIQWEGGSKEASIRIAKDALYQGVINGSLKGNKPYYPSKEEIRKSDEEHEKAIIEFNRGDGRHCYDCGVRIIGDPKFAKHHCTCPQCKD